VRAARRCGRQGLTRTPDAGFSAAWRAVPDSRRRPVEHEPGPPVHSACSPRPRACGQVAGLVARLVCDAVRPEPGTARQRNGFLTAFRGTRPGRFCERPKVIPTHEIDVRGLHRITMVSISTVWITGGCVPRDRLSACERLTRPASGMSRPPRCAAFRRRPSRLRPIRVAGGRAAKRPAGGTSTAVGSDPRPDLPDRPEIGRVTASSPISAPSAEARPTGRRWSGTGPGSPPSARPVPAAPVAARPASPTRRSGRAGPGHG
jgi:hypothetical protein